MKTEQKDIPETPSTPQQTGKAPLGVLRILLGCLLGGLAGFAPGLDVAPGLWITLILTVLLFRAPLLITLLVFGVSTALSFVTVGVCFDIGRFLLDGPTQDLFRSAINAPFLALFGLEYYVVSGGLLLGLALGLLAAILIIAKRKAPSDAPKPKGVLRPVGIALSLVFVGGLFALQSTAAESILTSSAASALGRVNGATVDVAGIAIDLPGGELGISDVAFSDPKSLNTDIFSGVNLTAKLSSSSLLQKRMHIELLRISSAKSGSPRGVPGVLIGEPSEPEIVEAEQGEKGIDDYLKDWEVWQDRLSQVRDWLETFSEDETAGGPDDETDEQRAEREASEFGFATVTASHLLTDSPLLTIDKILVEGLEFEWLAGETFELSASNLSTAPELVDGAMDIAFGSLGDMIKFGFTLPSSRLGEPGRLDLAIREIPLDAITSMLKLGDGNSLSGGSLDIAINGPWSGGKAGYIDLPLEVNLNNFELALAGSKTYTVSNLRLPIHLRGSIDNPNVRIDTDAITQSLMDAGLTELVGFVEAEKERLIGEGKDMLQAELDSNVNDALGDLLGTDVNIGVEDLLEGNLEQTAKELQDAATAKLEEEARAAAADELKALLGDNVGELSHVLEKGSLEDIQKALQDKATEQLLDEGKNVLKDKLGDKLKGLGGGLFGGKKD